MKEVAYLLIGGFLATVGYAYVGYPLILRTIAKLRRVDTVAGPTAVEQWPLVSVSLPAYNEEAQIRGALGAILGLDYPADRLQVVVISDASTDRTDEIVEEFAPRGVELLRMPRRGGKTVAENAGGQYVRGDIVLNTDASIRLHPGALKALAAQFADPSVGAASGRDVSVGTSRVDSNAGEAGYVGYEMGIRALETRVGGIIGASGCCYAIRAHLHREFLPDYLSRDFASALIAREHGYRTVSVDDALCIVPRTGSLRKEYRRKVRTMARGMETLAFKRHLLNPLRYGMFSWMLWSHKVVRWLVPWTATAAGVGLLLLAADVMWAQWILASVLVLVGLAAVGWVWPEQLPMPKIVSLPASAITGNLAALHATWKAAGAEREAIWEPTRRELVHP